MSYSKEEIEIKRQLAQLRRQQNACLSNKTAGKNLSGHSGSNNHEPSKHNYLEPRSNHGKMSPNKFYSSKGTSKEPGGFSTGNQQWDNKLQRNKPYTRAGETSSKIKSVNSKTSAGHKMTGYCHLISDTRFAVQTSSFYAPLIDALKTVSSRLYDVKTKTWSFHIKDYEIVMEKIIQFKSNAQITGLPKIVLQIIRRVLSEPKEQVMDAQLMRIDSTLLNSLMPFQREGIRYGISKNGRCMIADDMGLGKTIQALGIAHYFIEDWPLLIVTPSSVKYQWSDAIYTFLPSVPTHYISHFTNSKDCISDGRIVITSYDLLVKAQHEFERRAFCTIILDESHVLKCLKTIRFKAAQRVASMARHVILLSGTPALARPIELYSQISLIMPRFMGYEEYGFRYCDGKLGKFGHDFSGSSNSQELQLLLKHCCMIRRLKADVLQQLPKKRRDVIILKQSLIEADMAEMKMMSERMQAASQSRMETDRTLLQYYYVSSYVKQHAICEYVGQLFKKKTKCLVFAHHQHVLEAICDKATEAGVKFIKIDGKTNPEQRKFLVDKFQKQKNCLVAVLSITAASAGLNLTAAQLVIVAELFWSPGILCQAEDRVHRIGQDSDVVIQYLVAEKTADDYLWPLIQRKMKVLNTVGLDQDFSLTKENVAPELREKQLSITAFLNTSLSPESSAEMLESKDVVTSDEPTKTGTNTPGECSKSFLSEADELRALEELQKEEFVFDDWGDIP